MMMMIMMMRHNLYMACLNNRSLNTIRTINSYSPQQQYTKALTECNGDSIIFCNLHMLLHLPTSNSFLTSFLGHRIFTNLQHWFLMFFLNVFFWGEYLLILNHHSMDQLLEKFEVRTWFIKPKTGEVQSLPSLSAPLGVPWVEQKRQQTGWVGHKMTKCWAKLRMSNVLGFGIRP